MDFWSFLGAAKLIHPRGNDVKVVLATLLGFDDGADVESNVALDDCLHVVVVTGDHDADVAVGYRGFDRRLVINRFLHVLL